MSEARYDAVRLFNQRLVNQALELELDSSTNRKPVQLLYDWSDAFALQGSSNQTCGGVLYGLNLLQQIHVVGYAVQERITIVKSARDKCLD